MTAGLIRESLHATPFKAFDSKLVDGTVYHIGHPDHISDPPARHAREMIVCLDTANGDGYGIRWVNLGLVIELIVQSVPAGESNGA
jgi:hypothetical protein